MPGGNGDATATRLARQGYQEIVLVMRVRASCTAAHSMQHAHSAGSSTVLTPTNTLHPELASLRNAQVCPDGATCPVVLAAGNSNPSYTLQLSSHQLYVLSRVGQGASECEPLREAVGLHGCSAAATLLHGVTHGRNPVPQPFFSIMLKVVIQGTGEAAVRTFCEELTAALACVVQQQPGEQEGELEGGTGSSGAGVVGAYSSSSSSSSSGGAGVSGAPQSTISWSRSLNMQQWHEACECVAASRKARGLTSIPIAAPLRNYALLLECMMAEIRLANVLKDVVITPSMHAHLLALANQLAPRVKLLHEALRTPSNGAAADDSTVVVEEEEAEEEEGPLQGGGSGGGDLQDDGDGKEDAIEVEEGGVMVVRYIRHASKRLLLFLQPGAALRAIIPQQPTQQQLQLLLAWLQRSKVVEEEVSGLAPGGGAGSVCRTLRCAWAAVCGALLKMRAEDKKTGAKVAAPLTALLRGMWASHTGEHAGVITNRCCCVHVYGGAEV
jgi:hypothetical protein